MPRTVLEHHPGRADNPTAPGADMAESSTTTLTCWECGAEFERAKPTGQVPRYCPPCRTEVARRRSRLNARRYYSTPRPTSTTRKCPDCSGTFEKVGTSARQRCEDCSSVRKQHLARAYREKQATEKRSRLAVQRFCCTGCGSEIPRRSPTGRPPSKCDDCKALSYNAKKKRDAEAARAKRPPAVMDVVCSQCSVTFRRKTSRGNPPPRCPDCRRHHSLDYKRGYNAARWVKVGEEVKAARAARYERDGRWSRCRRCGMPVASPRMGAQRERCDRCAVQHRRDVAKKWREANPEAARTLSHRTNHKRRAARKNVEHEDFDSSEIFERDRWRCGICRKKINPRLRWPHTGSASLDHVIPLSEGGPHTRANCRAAHLGCNSRRNNRGGNEQLALLG